MSSSAFFILPNFMLHYIGSIFNHISVKFLITRGDIKMEEKEKNIERAKASKGKGEKKKK